jgi:AcrR family transcriptional regulator
MNDVADRLNITKPALYHYFFDKQRGYIPEVTAWAQG